MYQTVQGCSATCSHCWSSTFAEASVWSCEVVMQVVEADRVGQVFDLL